VEGSCEHGDEPLGSLKYWEVAAQLAASEEGLSSVSKYNTDLSKLAQVVTLLTWMQKVSSLNHD
jgi:hypothetical protein